MSDFYIYVLECEDNRYYIGKTNNPVFRIEQHNNGVGTVWTQKYKPIKVVETIETNDAFDEDKITKKYMMKFGIEFVRGGSYTKIKLDDWMIKSLEHEFMSAKDICYICKEKGHFAKECQLNNQFNIKQYLQNFNTINEIDNEILNLESAYERIIVLNKQITDTNIQKYNIDEYNKITKDYNKYNMLLKRKRNSIHQRQHQHQHLQQHLQQKGEILPTLDIDLAINELENMYDKEIKNHQPYSLSRSSTFSSNFDCYKQQKEGEVMRYKKHINQIYQIYFSNDKIYMESLENTDIKFYKINIFNLQQNKELKKLVELIISDELLKQKLYGLYEKKIQLITIDY